MKIIAGPCQVESFEHCFMMAGQIAEVSAQLSMPIIFKSSFDKANRSSGEAARGAGAEVALRAFRAIKAEFAMDCLTDVHEPWQCDRLYDVDVLQIPALLSRQTDLVEAAGRSGKRMNIKKGQFMAPWHARHAVRKARDAGAAEVWITERGTSFGHEDLVVDMRGFADLERSGADAVIFDATHSVQRPGSLDGATGGDRKMMPRLARAAIAAGADGIFVETHQDPDNAPSDGPVMWPVQSLYDFLAPLRDLHAFIRDL
jgi:2-dehydro-3-deoxyphosphooctonate aldolase (KDO 8-P synthase)